MLLLFLTILQPFFNRSLTTPVYIYSVSEAEKVQLQRISNGISLARIITMFWIFSTNFFPWIFPNYYGITLEEAAGDTMIFAGVMGFQTWLADRVLFWSSTAEFPPVTIFIFLSGFSLWFSIFNSGAFKLGDYALKRFNSIYVPFFIAALVTFFAGWALRGLEAEHTDLGALLMGGSLFAPSASRYNGALWFMSLLFLSYLFFPIIPIVYHRFRAWGLLALTLAAYAFFAFFGATYFLTRYGLLYPIMPFWLFLCLGVLACHFILVHKDSTVEIGRTRLGLVRLFAFPAIPAGLYLIYQFLYLEPAANPEGAWFSRNAFGAGVAGAFAFFFMGYVLPARFQRPLRWLANGTFTVFLYHYVIFYFAGPYVDPAIFTTHISILLASTYGFMLLCSSAFQHLLNATVLRFTRTLSVRTFEIRSPSAQRYGGTLPMPGAMDPGEYSEKTRPAHASE